MVLQKCWGPFEAALDSEPDNRLTGTDLEAPMPKEEEN